MWLWLPYSCLHSLQICSSRRRGRVKELWSQNFSQDLILILHLILIRPLLLIYQIIYTFLHIHVLGVAHLACPRMLHFGSGALVPIFKMVYLHTLATILALAIAFLKPMATVLGHDCQFPEWSTKFWLNDTLTFKYNFPCMERHYANLQIILIIICHIIIQDYG